METIAGNTAHASLFLAATPPSLALIAALSMHAVCSLRSPQPGSEHLLWHHSDATQQLGMRCLLHAVVRTQYKFGAVILNSIIHKIGAEHVNGKTGPIRGPDAGNGTNHSVVLTVLNHSFAYQASTTTPILLKFLKYNIRLYIPIYNFTEGSNLYRYKKGD
jgi:hypothetical protein